MFNNNNNPLHINVPPSVDRVSSIASLVACLNANLKNLKLNKKHTLLQVFQPDTDCVPFSSHSGPIGPHTAGPGLFTPKGND